MEKQQGNLNALLHGLVKTAVATIDAKKAEQQIVKNLHNLIHCDYMLVFQLQADAEEFTAHYPGETADPDLKKVSIAFSDPIAASLMHNSNSMMRVNERKPTLPLVNVELFTPLTNSQETIGFLYFGRHASTPFSDDDIRKADFIAPIVSLVLEHHKSKHDLDKIMQQDANADAHIEQLQSNLHRMQITTRGILHNLNFPTAIVDLNANSITNVNKSFLSLIKMQAGDLASYSLSDIITETGSDKYSTQVLLENSEKEKINMRVFKTLLDEKQPGKMLYLFMPVALQHEYAVSEFIRQFSNITMHPDIEAKIAEFISNEFDVKYTAFFKSTPREKLILSAVYERGNDASLPHPKAEKFNQKIFVEITDTQSPVSFNSISEKEYQPWQSIAKEMKYASLCALPLAIGQEVVGILALFSDNEVEWDNLTRPLSTLAKILSPALKWQQRQHEYQEQKSQVEAIIQFSQSINWSAEARRVYEQIVVKLHRLISFDYCSITKLDNKHEQRFEFSTEAFCRTSAQKKNWAQISHTKLGWITLHKEKVDNPAFSLPTNFSVLLMKNEKYVGNLALGRTRKHPFSELEKSLLRHLGPIIAGIANVEASSGSRVQDAEKLLNMMLNFHPDNNKNVLQELSVKLKESLNLDMVKIDAFKTAEPAQIFFSFLPEKIKKLLSTSKKEQFCKRILQTNKAVVVRNSGEFSKLFMLQQQSFMLRPTVIAPVIKNKKLVACIIAQMEETRLQAFADKAVPKIAKYVNHILENELNQVTTKSFSETESITLKALTEKMRELINHTNKNYGEWLPEKPRQDMRQLLDQLDSLLFQSTRNLQLDELKS